MSDKKHELLLIAGALIICAGMYIFSVFSSPQYATLTPATLSATTTAETSAATTAETSAVESSPMVNLNTDSIDELMTLEGIGVVKARAIIEYRKENGNFKHIEELKDVIGIGDAIFMKNAARIYI